MLARVPGEKSILGLGLVAVGQSAGCWNTKLFGGPMYFSTMLSPSILAYVNRQAFGNGASEVLPFSISPPISQELTLALSASRGDTLVIGSGLFKWSKSL